MTITETSTAVTFVVRELDLARILSNTILATETTGTVPALGAVMLELEAGTLQAIGTDRYRLHTDTAKVDGADGATASALVSRADVASVLKLIKGAGAVSVTLEGSVVAIRTENTTATYGTVDGDFPRWRILLPEHSETAAPDAPFAFNPAYLADFAKVVESTYRGNRKSNTARFQMDSARKPARVEIGETFVALLMPVRLPVA